MKVAIFGASGKTGTELVKQALARGHAVTAFVRDPARLAIQHPALRLVSGDIHDVASVGRGVEGQDAVICALGSRDLEATMIRTEGTLNIVQAMKLYQVKRLIVMSAMGVGDSWKSLSWFNKFLFAILLPASRKDHEAQEAAVQASGLEWTIIRPSGLTDAPGTGPYQVGADVRSKKSQISRSDVAALMLTVMEAGSCLRTAWTITQ